MAAARRYGHLVIAGSGAARFETPSFQDGPKDQIRNLEIPGSMLRIAPE
jgi:hypothetical protein